MGRVGRSPDGAALSLALGDWPDGFVGDAVCCCQLTQALPLGAAAHLRPDHRIQTVGAPSPGRCVRRVRSEEGKVRREWQGLLRDGGHTQCMELAESIPVRSASLLALTPAMPEIAWAGTAVAPVWREVVGIPGAAWSPLPVRRLVT
jgi:hypothetical protein